MGHAPLPVTAPVQGSPTVDLTAARDMIGRELRETLGDGLTLSGGVTFAPPATMTFERRTEIMRLVRAADLLDLLERFTPDDAEPVDVAALEAAVTVQAYEADALFLLYGAFLCPVGEPWSRDTMRRNAAVFAGLTEPADHAALDGVIVWLLLDFFLASVALSRTFPNYLKRATRTTRTPSRSNPGGAGAPVAAPRIPGPAATTNSASGTPVSEVLPGLGIVGP